MVEFKGMRIRKTRLNLSILILGLVIICLLFGIFAKKQSLFASAATNDVETQQEEAVEHYITFYDGDASITARSDARTVGEALTRANIKLGEYDTVEPGLDEKINEEDFYINIYRAREVLVVDGYVKKYIKTAKTAPNEIAEVAGITLLDADKVEIVPQNDILESGMAVAYQVVRAKVVNLNFYGKMTTFRTQAKTVAGFLKEQGISTDASKNWISIDKSQKIYDGISFTVSQQGKHTITVEENIPFGEAITYDYSVDYGSRVVTKAGKLGKKVATYEVDMKDGVEVSRVFVSEVVTQAPETQEVTVGMKVVLPSGSHEDWMAMAGISAADYGYVNFIIERESHWNPLSKNRSSGATGLCQALPGSKMASAGADWATNPITQLRWCNGYAVGRYGSWAKAYQFWTQHHWW